MEYNSYLQKWNDDDVMSFNDALCKVSNFRNAVNHGFTDPHRVKDSLSFAFSQYGVPISGIKLLNEGIDCEVLNLGSKTWQKGKIKIKVTVEFCPNEIQISQLESPLDDIRQTIKENSW